MSALRQEQTAAASSSCQTCVRRTETKCELGKVSETFILPHSDEPEGKIF